ncbi:MAG: LTA synthase family protein [Oscillospiraceae bacterium]|nr:LTA synthase family protein [Oscillospiraceae bacterium]
MIKNFFRKLKNIIKNIQEKQNKIPALILCQLYIILLSFSAVYFSFHISKNIEISALLWLWQHKSVSFLSFFIVFSVAELLYLLTFYLYVPLFTVYPAVILFVFTNYIKVFYRNETFVFTDLLLLKETGDIAGNYEIKPTNSVYFAILVFIFFIIAAILIKRVKIPLIPRITIPIAGVILFAFSFNSIIMSPNSYLEKKYQSTTWDLKKEYYENGFILGFVTSFKRSLVFAPDNYSKNAVLSSAEALGYDNASSGENGEFPEELPNIIVIMNESYWDCYNNLTGVAYNQDPMESVRDLMGSHGSGQLLSPLFGGGTSNIEYEFLTGKTIMFYPPNSIIYQQYITKKQWSLAWHFNDLGYSTSAIHPYYHWFWKRSTVFPLLGFENIYFDTDMKYNRPEDKKGSFISDLSLTNEIIDKYELLSDNGRVPIFNFSISMQNHGGYWKGIYKEPDVQIHLTSGNGDNSDDVCEVFGEGIRYASEAFVALTEYFENISRPTYIIMFGDHAPSFANNKYLYALDENAELYPEDILNQYLTPIIIWSNTGEKTGNIGTITPIMLTVEIFDLTGLPKPPYIKMLSDIKSTTSGFTPLYYLDDNGSVVEGGEVKQSIEKIIENLRYCQYDATLGKNYVIDEFE